MKHDIFLKLLAAFFFCIVLISCGEDETGPDDSIDDDIELETNFGIFTVIDDNTVEMSGEIESNTLDDFNDLIRSYPNINRINIDEVPGSGDDDINLEVSLKVHDLNIATHLMDNGLIASGGVDFFLAGTTRTKGNNTMIGVHSWSDGTNEATDFPEGDENHQPYIDYYMAVGFTEAEAESFYYFTINAAPAEDIYYMTEAEIEHYKVLKP